MPPTDLVVPRFVITESSPGATGASLVWRFDASRRAISSAVLGGGLGVVALAVYEAVVAGVERQRRS